VICFLAGPTFVFCVVASILATKTRRHEVNTKAFKALSDQEENVGKAVVGAAFAVHKELGPGLLEKVYEACFCQELISNGYDVMRQLDIPIIYRNIKFNEGLRLDVLVNDLVICELKAVDEVNPVWQAQLLSHLRLTGKRLGYLINFNVPLIKQGIRRMVL